MSNYIAFLLTLMPTVYMLLFSVSVHVMGIQLDQVSQSRLIATEIVERNGGYTLAAKQEVQKKVLDLYKHIDVVIENEGLKPYGTIVGIEIPATIKLMGEEFRIKLYSEALTQVIY